MKTSKLLLMVGAGLAIVVAGRAIYRRYKEEVKKLQKAEEQEEADMKEVGINPEYAKKEMIPSVDDGNLVKPLFMGVYGSPDFDEDIVIKAIEGDDNDISPLLFVMQSEYRGKQSLDLYLEIPQINERTPGIGDYIRSSKNLANNLNDLLEKQLSKTYKKEIKLTDKPFTSLCGYIVMEYRRSPEKTSESEQRVFKIPEVFYKKYADENHDGLVDFIQAVRGGDESAIKEVENMANEWLADQVYAGHEIFDISVVKLYLTFKISFRIASAQYPLGLTLPSGVSILKYITDNFSVTSKNNRKYNPVVEYRRVLFNAPDENGRWNFLKYYDKDENNHVIVEEYFWNKDI